MSIAEVPNSLLGREINMNSSHIGRLRSGARPLPKKHEFLTTMCRYFAGHITREYQITTLQKLTGIGNAALISKESTALYLEQWLLEQENDTTAATGRLISGFSRLPARTSSAPAAGGTEEAPAKYAVHLYGNAGKRKAVEQFFLMILQEKTPQTLLLFSDENMAWLYEDAAFAARWAELFTKVILKGNRVRIIHTISRDMNELLEAVTKWLPIYMTGAIEPYYYPRLRDGVFQRTMFIAPDTAAIVSTSVQQDTGDMLNLFLTDRAAVEALTTEFERYLALCRPLMRIFTGAGMEEFHKAIDGLAIADGNAAISCAMPPLFAMPEALAREIAERTGSEAMLSVWKKSISIFRRNIKKQRLSLSVLDPELALLTPEKLSLPLAELFGAKDVILSREQYLAHFARLKKLEKQYENLTVNVRSDLAPGMLIYAKEDTGVLMAKTDAPMSAFVISERNMINAVWDYIGGGK
jgi:hypothetical protein